MTAQKLGVKLATVYTTQDFNLGDTHVSPEGNTYVFMQADGAVTLDTFYVYDETTWQIEDQIDLTNFPADGKTQPLCVSEVTLADNEYTWAIVGPHNGFTGTSAEALDVDDVLYGHATAGALSDTASAVFVPMVTVRTAIGSATTGTFVAMARMYAYDLP